MHIVLLLGLALLLTLGKTASGEDLYVASYNVENLFDTADDPDVEDDEDFTPSAPKQWTPLRLTTKLNNLARAIKAMNDDAGPDVLGLCEIENREVVELLVAKLASLGRDYKIVHQDSPSDRGIDCAVIYDDEKFDLQESEFHDVDAGDTREIVEIKLRRGDNDLFVFMNHWPSRGNPEAHRIEAAQTLRERIDELLSADAEADVIVLGDLNDTPGDVSVRTQLGAVGQSQDLQNGGLFDTMFPFHQEGELGTYVFDNQWQVIDHIIVSRGLLDEDGFQWVSQSSQPLSFPFLLFNPPGPAIAKPNRSYSGNTYHESGTSDHLPVGCKLRVN